MAVQVFMRLILCKVPIKAPPLGQLPPQHPFFPQPHAAVSDFCTAGRIDVLPASSIAEHISENLCDFVSQDHAVDIPSGNGPSRVPPTQLIPPPSQQQDQQKSQGFLLYCRQFWALSVKRAISAKRDRLAVVMQLLVPILLVLLALRAGKASSSLVQEPLLLISRCAFATDGTNNF